MARPKRSVQHSNLQAEIISVAWEQIAQYGAPALSLRGISRELNITAPAIYNYFPRRDDLVTALIVSAFISFGDAQQEAISKIKTNEHAERLTALGKAYHDWALQYPERYQLIFGTPIAGYEAPAEITMPAAARSLSVLIEVLYDAWQDGKLNVPRNEMTLSLKEMLLAWQKEIDGVPVEVLYLALTTWSRVHGLVSIEIGKQFPQQIQDPGELFKRELMVIVQQTLQV